MASPLDWNNYRDMARQATAGMQQMPFVLDPMKLHGMSPLQAKAEMYPATMARGGGQIADMTHPAVRGFLNENQGQGKALRGDPARVNDIIRQWDLASGNAVAPAPETSSPQAAPPPPDMAHPAIREYLQANPGQGKALRADPGRVSSIIAQWNLTQSPGVGVNPLFQHAVPSGMNPLLDPGWVP